jgi:hypothetical protein
MTSVDAVEVLHKLRHGSEKSQWSTDFTGPECTWILEQLARLDPPADNEVDGVITEPGGDL